MQKYRIVVIASLLMSTALWLPSTWANNAPVVDIAQNNAQQPLPVPQKQTPPASVDSTTTINSNNNSATNNSTGNAPQNQTSSGALSPLVTPPSTQSMTMPQRVTRLEQQMANLINMGLPQQINTIQQQLQQLTGQLQVQAHKIKMLSDQQKSFYKDLSQRITKIQNKLSGNSGSQSSSISNEGLAATNVSAVVTTGQMKDADAYQAAFNLLSNKKYNQALTAFSNYIKHYPKGRYQVNAYYWMGEIYLKQKNLKKALQNFNTVVTQFPSSNKTPDAKLKIAIIHSKQGNATLARKELTLLIKQHPGTTAAQLASIQLQQLNIQ